MLKKAVFLLLVFPFLLSETEAITEVLKGGRTPAEKAIRLAREENKSVFLFFYKKGEEKSERMTKIIKEAEDRWSEEADFIRIDVNEGKEKEIISQYGIRRTPMTLVMASNGVIVAGFPKVVSLDDLEKAFVSPRTIEILGGLQQRKVIFLNVRDEDTQYAKENTKVLEEVAEVLGKSVKVVEVNPRDKSEEKLLKQIGVEPDITNSIVMVISQTGRMGDSFEGKVTNKQLFTAFKKVLAQKSGCGSGGSGGCGGR